MSDWVTPVVGLFGLLVGNVLNRSMEYRKWRRAERHRACTQLLNSGHAAMTAAVFHQAAATTTPLILENSFDQFTQLLNSGPKGRVLKPLARFGAKVLVRRMNPENDSKDVDSAVRGVLESVTARVEQPVVDLITERLGAGKTGRLTQLREATNELGLAVESVELICPRTVAETGHAFSEAALALFEMESDEGPSWDERLGTYSAARRNFVRTARRDLVRDNGLRLRLRRPRQP
ncbi:hypothetical protein HC031_14055 [Planosporangium thailandense]|uniref:Uncharacterized protein n=1 Tax=Planosporangium thailandense TaxID=765197 RepID=A0ABX0XXR1_9ACTN|nr:hypothetical protein [Planosporangium thailandense]NJC70831.1 hypothetical protein [Planosporangium thailandense]